MKKLRDATKRATKKSSKKPTDKKQTDIPYSQEAYKNDLSHFSDAVQPDQTHLSEQLGRPVEIQFAGGENHRKRRLKPSTETVNSGRPLGRFTKKQMARARQAIKDMHDWEERTIERWINMIRLVEPLHHLTMDAEIEVREREFKRIAQKQYLKVVRRFEELEK